MEKLAWADHVGPEVFSSVRVLSHPDRYHFPLHGHDGYGELTLVRRGVLHQRINGVAVAQETGGMCLLRPQDAHELWGEAVEYWNLAFAAPALDALPAARGRPADRLQRALDGHAPWTGTVPVADREAFDGIFRHLLREQGGDGDRLLCCHLLFTALARVLCPEEPATTLTAGGELPPWLAEALGRLRTQPDQVPQLPEFIAWCGRSQEHVTRTCQTHLGLSPSALLNQQRLEWATRLLACTDLPPAAVAERIGLHSTEWFYRLFRQRYACTPLTYRRRHQGAVLG